MRYAIYSMIFETSKHKAVLKISANDGSRPWFMLSSRQLQVPIVSPIIMPDKDRRHRKDRITET